MTLPSAIDKDALDLLMGSDPLFKEKMETATSLAEKIGHEALIEILVTQVSLQQLSEGGYPPEMEDVIKEKARRTFNRYRKFLDALSPLREPRLGCSYSPGESPIHSLPPEMLSVVFSLAAGSPSMIAGKRWMPCMLRLVCRHWKKVAEETPTLWRNIDLAGGSAWLQRSIQWSKSVPLDVYLGRSGPSQDGLFLESAEIALTELPRIRTLNISTCYGHQEIPKFAELLASRPAPLLTEFEFMGEDAHHDLCALHDSTFTGEIPERLRVLTVSWSKVLPSCPIFRAPLTTLNLQYSAVWQTVDQLLHTLADLPTLEHLVLRTNDDAPQLDASSVHDFKPQAVKLPNLQSLDVRDDFEVILAVFLHLDIPNATTVSITADYEDTDSLMHGDILSRMNSVFGSYLNHVFGAGDAPADAFTSLSIKPSTGAHDPSFSAVFTEPAVKRDGLLEFSLGTTYGSDHDYRALLMRTLSWAPMSFGITRLLATGHPRLLRDNEAWIQVIECLHNLEEVHVGQSAPQFIEVISTRGAEAARSLRKLVFHKAAIKDASIDALAALLSARHELGYPPIALSFITCTTTGEALDKLEGTSGVAELYVYMDPRKMSEATTPTLD